MVCVAKQNLIFDASVPYQAVTLNWLVALIFSKRLCLLSPKTRTFAPRHPRN